MTGKIKSLSQIFCRSGYTKLEGEDASEYSVLNKKWKPRVFPQCMAAMTASIGAFCLGSTLGWPSPALPDMELHGEFDNFKVNSEVASWISSLSLLAYMLSGFVSGYLIQRIGRKWTMLAMSPLFVAGWLCIALAPDTTWILVGRFISGICGGSFTLTVPVYASEIAQDNIRGILINFTGIASGLGVVFVLSLFKELKFALLNWSCYKYILASFSSWRTMTFICAAIPIFIAVGVCFIPETPTYLLLKGKKAEARKSLMWLRGAEDHTQVEEELELIESSIRGINPTKTKFRELLTSRILKPIFIIMMVMLFQQLCGITAVTVYLVDIFKSAGTSIDANLSGIIISVVGMTFLIIVNILFVERFGRRILLMLSELGITIGLLAFGAYYYFKETNADQLNNLGWLPLLILFVYILSFNLGMATLPFVLMGEMLPVEGKGVTTAIAMTFNWFLAFLMAKFFQSILIALNPYGCYWLFSGISFLGLIFCNFCVPETAGKSLREIELLFV